jgi:hypothetical protein
MGFAIRQYQLRGIDADSHPAFIKMEKKLGKQLPALFLKTKGDPRTVTEAMVEK